MKVHRYRLIPLILLVLGIGASLAVGLWLISRNPRAATNAEYFPRVGHNVKGEFLTFFRENGGLEIFGYPITEEFLWRGRVVQYFQRARMELHPEADPENRIQLGNLGEELELGTPRLPEPASDPEGRYCSQTGHYVAEEFLRFFNEKGGARVFGCPIAEVVTENGVKTQHYQRGWMALHPDQPGVVLAELGDIQLSQSSIDPSVRRRVPAILSGDVSGDASPIGSVDAQVTRPYVWYPEQQTLHVFVTDTDNQPLPEANVSYTNT